VAGEAIVAVESSGKRKGQLRLQRVTTHDHKLVEPARCAALAITSEQRLFLTRLEPIVKWSGRYPVDLEPKRVDGLDLIDAGDLRTFEGFAQLCRDTWHDITSKALPEAAASGPKGTRVRRELDV
jgi:hypothetical protein